MSDNIENKATEKLTAISYCQNKLNFDKEKKDNSVVKFAYKVAPKIVRDSIYDQELSNSLDKSVKYKDFDFKDYISQKQAAKASEDSEDPDKVMDTAPADGSIDVSDSIRLVNTNFPSNDNGNTRTVQVGVYPSACRKCMNKALSLMTGMNRDNLKFRSQLTYYNNSKSQEYDIPLVPFSRDFISSNKLYIGNEKGERINPKEYKQATDMVLRDTNIYFFCETASMDMDQMENINVYNEITRAVAGTIGIIKSDALKYVTNNILKDLDMKDESSVAYAMEVKKEIYLGSYMIIRRSDIMKDILIPEIALILNLDKDELEVTEKASEIYEVLNQEIAGSPLTDLKLTLGIYHAKVNIMEKDSATFTKNPGYFRKYKLMKADNKDYLIKIDHDRSNIFETPVDPVKYASGCYDSLISDIEACFLIWSENEIRSKLGYPKLKQPRLDMNKYKVEDDKTTFSQILGVSKVDTFRWEKEIKAVIRTRLEELKETVILEKVQAQGEM